MENSSNITDTIINTINTIFGNLFTSIDENLYDVLDSIVFINKDILSDKYFEKIFGTSTTNGILLIANSILIGFVLYYAGKYLISNYTYNRIESPIQFIFKCIIFGICMNSSFFIIEQILNINSNICELIRQLGVDLFGKEICFSTLIEDVNSNLSIEESSVNVFSLDGMIQGTLNMSLISLVFSYSLRYVTIKILILISPFAFLSLTMDSTSHFFKSWYKSLFSLLIVQILVSIVLVLLFSMDYTKGNLINKCIYIGGIYALIRANSTVRELLGGISTNVQTGINNLKMINK